MGWADRFDEYLGHLSAGLGHADGSAGLLHGIAAGQKERGVDGGTAGAVAGERKTPSVASLRGEGSVVGRGTAQAGGAVGRAEDGFHCIGYRLLTVPVYDNIIIKQTLPKKSLRLLGGFVGSLEPHRRMWRSRLEKSVQTAFFTHPIGLPNGKIWRPKKVFRKIAPEP